MSENDVLDGGRDLEEPLLRRRNVANSQRAPRLLSRGKWSIERQSRGVRRAHPTPGNRCHVPCNIWCVLKILVLSLCRLCTSGAHVLSSLSGLLQGS